MRSTTCLGRRRLCSPSRGALSHRLRFSWQAMLIPTPEIDTEELLWSAFGKEIQKPPLFFVGTERKSEDGRRTHDDRFESHKHRYAQTLGSSGGLLARTRARAGELMKQARRVSSLLSGRLTRHVATVAR